MAKICPAFIQTPNLLLEPKSWELILIGGAKECITATRRVDDKKKAAQNFHLWLNKHNPEDMVVYTDGSQRLDKAGKIAGTRAAWTIECKRQWFGTNGFSLGANAKVYDAEIIGPCGELEVALSSPIAGLASEIHICTDNLNIAKEARSVPNGSSQAAFIRFRERVKSWLQNGRKVSVQWVPSHMGIIGNKKADQEAKRYAAVVPTPMTKGVQTLCHRRKSCS